MGTAEYPFPDFDDRREPARLGMAAQLAVVAAGTFLALLAGVALVMFVSG
jgi:hypothetical protein